MADHGLPALTALFVWWFSTGIILWLDGLPRETYRWSMLAATALLGVAFHLLGSSAWDASVGGAYLAFLAALMVWAWQEMAFLMGYLTGPRTAPSPPGTRGFRRAVHATQAILWHELTLIAAGIAVVAITWGGPNQIGAWTYLLLWAMRLSAKLNVFLGVRNLFLEWLPDHLQHLRGFLRQRPMNLLFPFSVTGATLVAALLFHLAFAAGASDFQRAGFTFLGTLATLAVLEHWFLVLPIPVSAIWNWSLRSRGAAPAPHARPTPCAAVEP